jgi:hypothetical protein
MQQRKQNFWESKAKARRGTFAYSRPCSATRRATFRKEASSGPTRRALLRSLQELWIELGNKNKELLQSEQRVLKETQVLYTLHEQFMGV